ncbi:MAG: D-alanyl-D-alanine carboxypeptidase, partial [Desulfobulbaceae bacterium]|nr:D-alanyl-D-alanine carboxypeptidase [Desulfobulbaceae bacterium]
PPRAPGTENSFEPYDAANSGLAVNFNAITIEVAADGTVRSAEQQTPLLPVMTAVGATLSPGIHRVNLSQQLARISAYVGELFQAFLSRQGVVCSGAVRTGKVPESARLLYRHLSSFTLLEVVGKMMHYSNNFIANQLFLSCGAEVYGGPATWRKGAQALSAFLLASEISKGNFQVKEGSGLSRENKITAAALLRLLKAFAPYAHLLPKMQDRLLKSGTLTGVYSYAGYFVNGADLDPFVLILNQSTNVRSQVLDRLEMRYRAL